MKPKSRVFFTAAAIAGSVALLSACAPSGGGAKTPESQDAAESGAATEIVTDISGLPEQTLTVWDQEIRGGQNEQIERLNAAFMEKYPNITIDRVSQSFDDLEATLRLALTGDDAPDVVQANNSRGIMGQFVAAKQILCLEDYAKAYGWDESFSESILSYSSYSEDAVDFGEGCVYGLPQVGEVVGVFYSKERLAEAGLEVPATWDEFAEQLQKIKDSGQTPLMLGNVEKWPGIHVWGPVQGAHVPAEEIRTLGFGNPGGSWDTEGNIAAAQQLQDWADAGYFNNGFNGADYDAVWQDFAKGEGVYLIGGSWLGPDLDAVMGEDVAFFNPPAADVNGVSATTGGTGLPFAITSAAKDPNVAAAYIDFLTNDDAMKVLAETGNVPVRNAAEFAKDETGVTADIMNGFEQITTTGQILPYMDYATPTMGDDLGAALQELMDGRLSPEEFAKRMEGYYSAFADE